MADPGIGIGDVATWLGSIVALISAAVAARASKEADEHQRKAAQYQEDAARYARKSADLLEKQHNLELREWIDQYFDAVKAWADRVCCCISEALHFAEAEKNDDAVRMDLKVRLSALLDIGRWYFPNQWSEDYGTHKEPAYRGIRQPIMDCVLAAYECVGKAPWKKEHKQSLVDIQREFVSHVQAVLDPRTREAEIKKIIKDFESSERLRNAPGKR